MSKADQSKIYDYLSVQNRPYSVNDVFLNLHKEIGKTAVQKALDILVQSDSVKEKTYGKQKVYVVNQEDLPSCTDEKLKELDAKIKELNDELQEQTKILSDSEVQLRAVNNSMTTQEMELKSAEVEKEVNVLEEQLERFKMKGGETISKVEKERVELERSSKVKEWRKRRRMATDILDTILESYPKSKKELFDEVGIETDQDVGVDINCYL